jgi:hypothetical protein
MDEHAAAAKRSGTIQEREKRCGFMIEPCVNWPVYGLPTDGPLGIVFRPRSNVVAFNATTVDQTLYFVDLYGYLSR